MYLLPCTADESLLFGNTVLNVGDVEKRGLTTLSGDESPAAEFNHEGLNGFNVSFAVLDSTRNTLTTEKETIVFCKYVQQQFLSSS